MSSSSSTPAFLASSPGIVSPQAAGRYSASVSPVSRTAIVTSDNPRTEDPDTIIDDIVGGMAGHTYERVTDRRAAIRRALDVALPGDTVVLAGKGHESSQVIGAERLPFDERTIVREWLEARGR